MFAERTSNGELHLEALSEMLNLFAATGHINYAECPPLPSRDQKTTRNTSMVVCTIHQWSSHCAEDKQELEQYLDRSCDWTDPDAFYQIKGWTYRWSWYDRECAPCMVFEPLSRNHGSWWNAITHRCSSQIKWTAWKNWKITNKARLSRLSQIS